MDYKWVRGGSNGAVTEIKIAGLWRPVADVAETAEASYCTSATLPSWKITFISL